MPKPLYQARYRGKSEWTWEYTTRGYTVTDLEKAKKPCYKWLEEAKKRNKPLQVQVVIVDPEKRWGEVMWEDFYLKEEFYKESERCQIVKDITKDLLEEECQTEDDKCKIAKEITENIVSRECTKEIPAPVRIGAVSLRSLNIEPIGFYQKPPGLTGKDIDIYYEVSQEDYDTLEGKTLLTTYLEYENKPIDIFVTDRKRLMASVQISPQEVKFMEKPPGERYKLSLPDYVLEELVEWE